ncbi:MAG: hypothetical protein WBL85_09665 [Sedimentisphaerales bacterium]
MAGERQINPATRLALSGKPEMAGLNIIWMRKNVKYQLKKKI